jgi:branched-chain amino acid transport system permease protein
VVAIVGTLNLVRSRIGRAFIAIRDQDIAAEIIGINIFRYKLLAFAISSFYAGVTGRLCTRTTSGSRTTSSSRSSRRSTTWR